MSKIQDKRVLVISAVNFFEGGPLSLLNDCLDYLDKSELAAEFKIIALVYKKELFCVDKLPNINFNEIPSSRKSYIHRLYFEYLYFKKFAKINNVYFWLSLHDITPNLDNIRQAVYCHNPSPFNQSSFKYLFVQPTQFFFNLFYKYVYKINIKKNKFVIVQQSWIRDRFYNMFNIQKDRIVVAIPQVSAVPDQYLEASKDRKEKDKVFFFPSYPRPFKNIEVICKAVNILNNENIGGFKVILTIDGTENKYSKKIYDHYNSESNLEFIGLLKREDVYKLYREVDWMIFPSKLETWGLPISEFKQYDKPMLVADLNYAKETVGDYDKAKFFTPTDASQLASYMRDIILGNEIRYSEARLIKYSSPFAQNWHELFLILLAE